MREPRGGSRRYANLRPPPKLSLSQWAERYAVLSRETSAQTGRFRAFGYQTGIMDAITDPAVETVTVMKSARVGYTKILDHVVGYFRQAATESGHSRAGHGRGDPLTSTPFNSSH